MPWVPSPIVHRAPAGSSFLHGSPEFWSIVPGEPTQRRWILEEILIEKPAEITAPIEIGAVAAWPVSEAGEKAIGLGEPELDGVIVGRVPLQVVHESCPVVDRDLLREYAMAG